MIALRRCFLECVVVMFWIAAAFQMLLVRIVDLACNRDAGKWDVEACSFRHVRVRNSRTLVRMCI